MKYFFTGILITLCLSSFGQAVTDTVSVQPGYALQSYYSLFQGVQGTHMADAWDLAFDVSGFGSGIRINDANGVELYKYTAGDSSSWASVDTNGISTWAPAYNSDTSWSTGAFNRSADGNFNLGWGTYNIVTHGVYGDSLFVLKLANGSYKKIWIQSLISGVYTIRHADLDNSNDRVETLTKSNYTDRNFAYYAFSSNTFSDLEPASSSWDLHFGRYVAPLAPGVYYGVTGVFHHPNVGVAEVRNIDSPSASWSGQTLDSNIGVIGWDWKSFNSTIFSYDIEDSLTYFVKDQNNTIWKVVFTGFGGSSTGEFMFGKEQVAVSRTERIEALESFTVYPNPVSGPRLNVLADLTGASEEASLRLFTLNGRMIKDLRIGLTTGLNPLELSVEGLPNGLYLLELSGDDFKAHQKVLIQR